MKVLRILSIIVIGTVFLSGCAKRHDGAKESALTIGMAKKNIYPKQTTQAEIL